VGWYLLFQLPVIKTPLLTKILLLFSGIKLPQSNRIDETQGNAGGTQGNAGGTQFCSSLHLLSLADLLLDTVSSHGRFSVTNATLLLGNRSPGIVRHPLGRVTGVSLGHHTVNLLQR